MEDPKDLRPVVSCAGQIDAEGVLAGFLVIERHYCRKDLPLNGSIAARDIQNETRLHAPVLGKLLDLTR